METDYIQMQATPNADLIAQLLDSRIPKTEREHAAAREIERLRERIREAAKLNMRLMELRSENEVEIERMRGDLDSMIEHNDNQKAEIERLRDFIRRDWPYDAGPLEVVAARDAEIERLRAAVRYAAQSIDAGVPILEVRDTLLEKTMNDTGETK